MDVVILAFNGAQLLDVVAVADLLTNSVFATEGTLAYKVHIATLDGKPVKSSNGIEIIPDCSADQLPVSVDTLLLPGGAFDPKSVNGREIINWIVKEASGFRRICSICNAAFLLGEAGLLDGREVTTHWRYASLLAEQFPAALVRRDRLLVKDGTVITTGGGTANFDLALKLIEEDLGADRARRVARDFVIFPTREDSQKQYSDYFVKRHSTVNVVQIVQEWAKENLAKPISPEQMALHAGLSLSNFEKMFERDTGMTPTVFLKKQRLSLAAELLVETNLSVKEIARRCGFADTYQQRGLFIQAFGLAPIYYRFANKKKPQ